MPQAKRIKLDEAYNDVQPFQDVTAEKEREVDKQNYDRGGFGQLFGASPAIAGLTFLLDTMLFAGEVATGELIWPLSVIVGIALAIITWRAQIKLYGDDKETAVIKAGILGLLMAIPVPLPAVLSVPAGAIGWIHTMRRKKVAA